MIALLAITQLSIKLSNALNVQKVTDALTQQTAPSLADSDSTLLSRDVQTASDAQVATTVFPTGPLAA